MKQRAAQRCGCGGGVGRGGRVALALLFGALIAPPAPSARAAATPPDAVEIAAAICLTGDEQSYSRSAVEGIQLAIDEANETGAGRPVRLRLYDEQSNADAAAKVAAEIAASPAPFALGSVFTFLSLSEGPIFAKSGMAALATATSDLITRNPTTFALQFRTSEQGQLLANYVDRVLGLRRVAVIAVDDGYGQTMRGGFQDVAARLGLNVSYYAFKTRAEADAAVASVAADPTKPAVVLMMLDNDGVHVLAGLRHSGVTATILGGNTFGEEPFSQRLAGEPEERIRHGALSDGLYAISPMILDSADAEVLAFAERYRARYGRDPSGLAAEWYDLGRLAVAAVRAVEQQGEADPATMRARALAYFRSLSAPADAVQGLLGSIWFDQSRGRPQAMRIGRFVDGRLESAALQVVPVDNAAASEVASGAVFEMAPGRFGRLQRVIYAGVYLNAISHVDMPKSSFGADFYVWLRFAKEAGPDAVDPSDIYFPNMLTGAFDPARPAEQGEMPDGAVYRLWRVQGEFRNDYDLHNFPFDRQRLELPFFNARGASDRIVYVVDRRTATTGAASENAAASGAASRETPPIASPTAFNDLTQWDAIGGVQRRENLVTASSLGDPRLENGGNRELSGFVATFDVKRRALSTVIKSLMPLLLMTLIIYTTLHFPPVLIKEKVTVAVSGALSGAVLLTAINNQLGSIGYTTAIEYAFFVFFGLTTFSIVGALAGQHFRHVKRDHLAVATEWGTRVVFVLAVLTVLAGAWWVSASAESLP